MVKKKKVMQFIHGLNTGGAETLVKDYALNFDKTIFDVVVLCLSHEKDSPYEKILQKNKISMIYVQDFLPFKKQINIFKKIVNYLFRFFVVRNIIRKESPDVLHSHLRLNALVKFSKPKRETVIMHTVHNEPKILWGSGVRKRKDFSAAKWLVKNYNMNFVVLHETMRDEINELFGVKNSIILNNGVDVSRYKGVNGRKRMKENLKIPETAFVIGHVGRFSRQKNHDFLIDILKEIKDKEVFLLMIGDGKEKHRIIKELHDYGLDNYLILSNRDDVPELLKIMDVFVFPSYYEGLPISLVEAQMAKLPCFISDTIDNQVIISNLVMKLSLERGPGEWANSIINYKKPQRIKIDDREWDIKKITRKLEQIYLSALAEKQNGKK